MKTTPRIQKIVTELAEKHGLDLTASDAHLHLENKPYEPLVIEKTGLHLVSLAHYYTQNGDLIPDPDIVFFTGYAEWVPVEITQMVFGNLRTSTGIWLTEDRNKVQSFHPKHQASIAEFCEDLWAPNLIDQGWLNAAKAS